LSLCACGVWAEGWPELEKLIEPLVDSALANASTIERPGNLEVGIDIVIEGYREDLYIVPLALDRARSLLAERGAAIIIGKPKSGKTRLALELLHEQADTFVVVPHADIPPAQFEPAGLAGRQLVLFLDDLQQAAPTMDPLGWWRLKQATGKRCLILCTSRDGRDWQRVQEQPRLKTLLAAVDDRLVVSVSADGTEFTREQADQLAASLRLSAAEVERRFDGTPGSLALDLTEMRRRCAGRYVATCNSRGCWTPPGCSTPAARFSSGPASSRRLPNASAVTRSSARSSGRRSSGGRRRKDSAGLQLPSGSSGPTFPISRSA